MNLSLKISIAFNGQGEAAFRFYEQCLSGTITYMLTWGNSPVAAEAPPGWHTKIYHATLQIGDAAIKDRRRPGRLLNPLRAVIVDGGLG